MKAHPYADAWPMLGEDELADLTADIAENGLRDPIIIHDDLILDGRNRFAACERAGIPVVKRIFEGDDDAALAFVQSVNNARRHQSKGSLAASWAISMLTAGKRTKDASGSGRWAQGSQKSGKSKAETEMYRICGVIADFAPGLLTAVRDDKISLNAAHMEAENARDAERLRMEREQREVAEEAEAKAFVEASAPDLAARVDGNDLQSYREAQDLWQRRNREEAERIAAQKAEKKRKAAEHRRAMTDLYTGMSDALGTCAGYGGYSDITELMAEFGPHHLKSPQEAHRFDLDNLRLAGRFIDMLIDWQENRRAA